MKLDFSTKTLKKTLRVTFHDDFDPKHITQHSTQHDDFSFISFERLMHFL